MPRHQETLGRRGFLGLAGVAGLGGAGVLAGCSGSGQTGQLIRSDLDLPEPFTVPLPIAPVLQPVSTSGGVDRYRLEARAADVELLPGVRTPMLTYGGGFPGPTLETRRGRPVVVEHVNSLPVPMVVHLHGGVVPAESDGFPTDLVLPVAGAARARPTSHAHAASHDDPQAVVTTGRREYAYPGDQPAALLWYHDHRMDFTGPMVYRGLAGMHVVRDDVEDALPLPRGDRELLLMLSDKAFDADGELVYPSLDPTLTTTPGVEDFAMEGVLGDVVLVNGAPWPVAEVDAARHRLRFLNGSNARRYRLRLDPAPPSGPGFVQIGSDAGLLEAPLEVDQLTLAPAERVDVLLDLGAYPVGSEVTVVNDLGSGSTSRVMRFRVVRAASDDTRVPERLAEVEQLDPTEATILRTFRFTRGDVGGHSGWTINGAPFDPVRMDARIRSGEVERWRFVSDAHHPVHVHLAHFQVVGRGSGGLTPADAGWKDTVDVRPGEVVEVLLRFPDLPGRYVMHCHNLEHEDMKMMSAFEVL